MLKRVSYLSNYRLLIMDANQNHEIHFKCNSYLLVCTLPLLATIMCATGLGLGGESFLVELAKLDPARQYDMNLT